jgi:transposase InsO family protein
MTRKSKRIMKKKAAQMQKDQFPDDPELPEVSGVGIEEISMPPLYSSPNVTSTPMVPVVPASSTAGRESLFRSHQFGSQLSVSTNLSSVSQRTTLSVRQQRRLIELETKKKMSEAEYQVKVAQAEREIKAKREEMELEQKLLNISLEQEYKLAELDEDDDEPQSERVDVTSGNNPPPAADDELFQFTDAQGNERFETVDEFLQRITTQFDEPPPPRPQMDDSQHLQGSVYDYSAIKPPKSRYFEEDEARRQQRQNERDKERPKKRNTPSSMGLGAKVQANQSEWTEPPVQSNQSAPPPPKSTHRKKKERVQFQYEGEGQQGSSQSNLPPPESKKTSGGEQRPPPHRQQQSRSSKRGVEIPLHEDSSSSSSSESEDEDKVDRLVTAMTAAFAALKPTATSSTTHQFLARQSHAKDLPLFSGKPEEWPAFYSAYQRTTATCGFSADENLIRLQKCLKGDAAKSVQSLMVSPLNVPEIISTLQTRYGQPKYIIEAMTIKAKQLPAVREDKMESLIEFGTAVRNLTSTIKSLNCDAHLSNPTLLMEMERKLPNHMRLSWMQWLKKDVTRKEDLDYFSSWLKKKVDLACQLCPPKFVEEKKPSTPSTGTSYQKKRVFAAADQQQEESTQEKKEPSFICYGCEKPGHSISSCQKFQKASVPDRWKAVKKHTLCYSCLRPGHPTTECRRKNPCSIDGCKYNHHKLLHKSVGVTSKQQVSSVDEKEDSPSVEEAVSAASTTTRNEVLLRFIPVTLSGPKGQLQCYAFCDEGATVSLLEESVAEKLGLRGPVEPLCMTFLGKEGSSHSTSRRVNLQVAGIGPKAKSFQVSGVRTINNLGLPKQSLQMEELKKIHPHLRSLCIRSVEEAKPVLLLGCDQLHLTAPRRIVEGSSPGPVATECLLGWSVGGDTRRKGRVQDAFGFHICEAKDEELHRMVKQSFSTEDFGVKIVHPSNRSREDLRAEEILKKTTKRIGDRFESGLLWKSDQFIMPSSYSTALARLKCQERKMDRDASFSKLYCEKMEEYVDKGFIFKMTAEQIATASRSPRAWFLPHFAVAKLNKPGKIRLVFDAAAKSQGYSFNDFLVRGPDLLQPLPSVLMKFREGNIGFTGDIMDMFHQVVVREEDLPSQQFLWRGMDRTRPPDIYQMRVMTFGSTSSPCTSSYVKNLNAEEQKEDFPQTWQEIIHNHYVDDYLGVADSDEEAIKKIMEVREIHRRGGFNIVNWTCSSKKVISQIPPDIRSKDIKEITMDSELPVGRVLGLVWEPEPDIFTFRLNFSKVKPEIVSGEEVPTKREVLRLVMSLFDPLGFLSHFTMKAKVLLQSIWQSEVEWDAEIPERLYLTWKDWLTELKGITTVRIPRCYCLEFSRAEVELHVFVDASESAFAAACYFRMKTPAAVTTAIVCAKARVAPLKRLSIPRLELQGAVLGTRLAKAVRDSHRVPVIRTIYWTDSRTVLCWLRSDSGRFKQFVSHRIGEIHESTNPSEWRWIPSKENVADDATRDSRASEFAPESRWMRGPKFLVEEESSWPTEPQQQNNPEEDLELIPVWAVSSSPSPMLPDPSKYSSLRRLVRVTAWCRRFIRNSLLKVNKQPVLKGGLLVRELQQAEKELIRQCQQDSFQEEIVKLKRGEELPRASKLLQLSPSLDGEGLLILKGRLDNLPVPSVTSKRPFILDGKHPFSKLLVMDLHQRSGHLGREYVVNEIRQQYWIIGIRSVVKKVWKGCQFCSNRRARSSVPEMGQLPAIRLQQCSRPFTITGLDYFGPLEVIVGRSRQKRYGALFTCLTTRAVHVEVAHSLDTDSAIMAIRRFISRRGSPTKLYSDNGTNFHGAERELRESLADLDQTKIHDVMTAKGIEWHFIPPGSPHMGGAWERMVQSVKKALYAVLKEKAPRDEVLYTLIVEAEHIVNSRPLTFVSSDPDDPEAITPNHFLIGRSSNNQSPGVLDEADLCLRRQWRISQRLTDHFWKRWIREYVPTLIKRAKWHGKATTIKVGEVVLLADDDGPRNSWPLGRIIATYPGKDGQVRVVDVKTAKGTYRRPVIKIIPLNILEGEIPGSVTSKNEGEDDV